MLVIMTVCTRNLVMFILTLPNNTFYNNDLLFTGVRQEQDIFVRLIDSVTKQVIIYLSFKIF